METITFRCTTCQSTLKVGADKAGRSAKCTKCGTALKIPAAQAAESPPPVAVVKQRTQQEIEDSQAYGMKELPSAEDEERQRAEREKPLVAKGPGRVEIKKLAKISNPDEWRKVGFGVRVIAGGLCVWLAAYLFFRLPLVIGMTVGPEYAVVADTKLVIAEDNPSGQPPGLKICSYAVALVAGNNFAGGMIWAIRLALVLFLLQGGVLAAGYFICLAAPGSSGIRLQLYILFGLTIFNSLFLVFFKLLPMCGAYSYTILPIALPEVAMMEMNADRIETIFTMWLKWPIFEAILTVVVTLCLYSEAALIATLVHTVAKAIKSEPLEVEGLRAMKLGYSQLFIQLAWFMAAICGSGLVLLWILRFVYAVGAGFFIYQLAVTAIALFHVAPTVEEQLGEEDAKPREEAEDQGQEDEDE